MSNFQLLVNVYDNGLTGHSNVTFVKDGVSVTIGANVGENITLLGFSLLFSTSGSLDGIVQFESNTSTRPGIYKPITLTEEQYNNAYNYAIARVGEPYNFGALTCSCFSFVQDIYSLAGQTGGYGSLFSPAEIASYPAPVWAFIPGAPPYSIIESKGSDTLETINCDQRAVILQPKAFMQSPILLYSTVTYPSSMARCRAMKALRATSNRL